MEPPERSIALAMALVITVAALPASATLMTDARASSDSHGAIVFIPPPETGEVFRYASPDMGTLTVAVDGPTVRQDGLARNHTVVDLDLSWWHERSNHTYELVSSVGAGDGLIVNEFARCGVPALDSGSEGKCLDERGMLLFASGGLPGGLLAAPFWGEDLTPSEDLRLRIHPFTSPQESLSYKVASSGNPEEACVNLTTTTEPSPHLRPIERLMPLHGPVTLCDGLAMPDSFETVDGTTWTLQDHERGFDGIELSDGSGPWTAPGKPLPSRTWKAPLLTDSPQVHDNISVEEAHQIALEKSEAYRGLFTNGTDPLVVSTYYHDDRSGSSIGPAGGPHVASHRHSVRGLSAIDAEGHAVDLEVVEHIHTVLGFRSPVATEEEHSIRSETELLVQGQPTVDSLEPRQAYLSDALERGRTLTGQPTDRYGGYGMEIVLPGHGWDPSTRTLQQHGYTLVSYHEDPSQYAPGIDFPYEAVFDGRTGATLWALAENTTLRPG